MAVDTEAKRWSMLGWAAGPPRIIVFNPDTSGLADIEKITILQHYGGIAWGADVTAPVLSNATGTATSLTTADGTVDTDEGNGTLYWVVTDSASQPSAAQIQAGQDHTGSPAQDSGSQAVSATGSQAVSATISAGTWYFHYQQQDAAANDSAVESSAAFAFVSDEKRGGAGGWRRHGKKSWWVIVGDERHKVTSKAEEQGLIESYVERKQQELAIAVAGTETTKARGIRISLTRAIKRLEETKQAAEKERIQRLMQDDEDLMFILSLH